METWDPKPATDTGGPFQTIPTSVPGVHISELLPHTAQQMHHLALVRSVNTNNTDHAKGDYMMQTGYRQTPGFEGNRYQRRGRLRAANPRYARQQTRDRHTCRRSRGNKDLLWNLKRTLGSPNEAQAKHRIRCRGHDLTAILVRQRHTRIHGPFATSRKGPVRDRKSS